MAKDGAFCWGGLGGNKLSFSWNFSGGRSEEEKGEGMVLPRVIEYGWKHYKGNTCYLNWMNLFASKGGGVFIDWGKRVLEREEGVRGFENHGGGGL